MPVPVADSLLSRHLEAAVLMVADSPMFRTVVEAANQTEALAHVHVPYASDYVDPDTQLPEHPRPRAIVSPCSNFRLGRGGPGEWRWIGDVWFVFEFPPDPDYLGDRHSELMWFLNVTGKIVEEMALMSGASLEDGSGTYANVTDFILVDGPAECEIENERGEVFYAVVWRCPWC
jgi:hypothetical protein